MKKILNHIWAAMDHPDALAYAFMGSWLALMLIIAVGSLSAGIP